MPSLKKFQEKLEKSHKANLTENLSEEAYRALEKELASAAHDPRELLALFKSLNPDYQTWEDVLRDNPGIMEEIGNWLLEWADRVPEWKATIEQRYAGPVSGEE